MFDPPITEAANTFTWIVVVILAFAGTLTIMDILRETGKKNHASKEEKPGPQNQAQTS